MICRGRHRAGALGVAQKIRRVDQLVDRAVVLPNPVKGRLEPARARRF